MLYVYINFAQNYVDVLNKQELEKLLSMKDINDINDITIIEIGPDYNFMQLKPSITLSYPENK